MNCEKLVQFNRQQKNKKQNKTAYIEWLNKSFVCTHGMTISRSGHFHFDGRENGTAIHSQSYSLTTWYWFDGWRFSFPHWKMNGFFYSRKNHLQIDTYWLLLTRTWLILNIDCDYSNHLHIFSWQTTLFNRQRWVIYLLVQSLAAKCYEAQILHHFVCSFQNSLKAFCSVLLCMVFSFSSFHSINLSFSFSLFFLLFSFPLCLRLRLHLSKNR